MGERLISVGKEHLVRVPPEVMEALSLAEGGEVEFVVEDGEATLRAGRPPWRVPIVIHLDPGVKAEDIEFFSEEDLDEWSNQGSDFDENEITWPQEDIDRWLAQSDEENKAEMDAARHRQRSASSGSSVSRKAKGRKSERIAPA